MSVYREVELRCDGIATDRYGCDPAIYDKTAAKARRQARREGWLVNQPGGRDFCERHRPRRAALPEETDR